MTPHTHKMTFFNNPDRLLPCPAGRNKVLRQFFFLMADVACKHNLMPTWFVRYGRCHIRTGRLTVRWDMNPPNWETAKLVYDTLYEVMQQQERRMLSREIRYYTMNCNMHDISISLELLIPNWWPELYALGPQAELSDIIAGLAGKDAK
jgi:hypothetical protein